MSEQTLHSIRFANGTTALWVVLKALGCRDGFIAVPSTICPSVICAIFASGNRPYFVDIEQQRLGLDPVILSTVLPHVNAVIAVHAFGIPCKIKAIAEICKESGIPLIEDCCQSQGADYDGTATGQFGDIAIYSYGAGKIIEAGGGGAAETRNPLLADKVKSIAEALSVVDEEAVSDLGLFYKFFYNQFYPDRLAHYQEVFNGLLKKIAPKMLGKYPDSLDEAIQAGLDNLSSNIHDRREKSALYAELLGETAGVQILQFPEGSVPWRFNVLMNFPVRQFVLKRMLGEGAAVSSWSPDISQFMDRTSYKSTPLPNSTWLSEGIFNLWLNDSTEEKQIVETCAHIKALLAEYQHAHGQYVSEP